MIATILFTVYSQVQLWLSYLQQACECEEVKDSIINFTPVVNNIVLGQFHALLPPTFTLPKKTKKDNKDKINGLPRKKEKKKVNTMHPK